MPGFHIAGIILLVLTGILGTLIELIDKVLKPRISHEYEKMDRKRAEYETRLEEQDLKKILR